MCIDVNLQAHELLLNFEEPLKDYVRAVQSIKVNSPPPPPLSWFWMSWLLPNLWHYFLLFVQIGVQNLDFKFVTLVYCTCLVELFYYKYWYMSHDVGTSSSSKFGFLFHAGAEMICLGVYLLSHCHLGLSICVWIN